jgi:transposase-like protein
MNIQEVLDPKSWAEQSFGGVQLHDLHRTRRAVKAATEQAKNPLGSLPAQMHTWNETKALYRLLDEPDVTEARVDAPAAAPDQGTSHFLSRGAVRDARSPRVHGPGTLCAHSRSRWRTTSATPPAGSVWVHVGDRGAAMFPFFQACQATQTHFLVRAGKSRRVQESEDEIKYSLMRARS